MFGKNKDKALCEAATNGDAAEARKLIDAGAQPHPDGLNGSAFLKAIVNKRADVVEVMLEAGADPSITGDNGWTPLIYAANKDSLEIVKLLVDAGADVSHANMNHRDTALHWAIHHENDEMARLLVDAGADAECRNKSGLTPVSYAASNLSVETMAHILTNGTRVDATDTNGATPLAKAAMSGRMDMARFLVEAGADIKTAREYLMPKDADKAKQILAYLTRERDGNTVENEDEGAAYRLENAHTVSIDSFFRDNTLRLTTIFNFEAREVVTVTNDNGVGNTLRTAFDDFSAKNEIAKAQAALVRLGGKPPGSGFKDKPGGKIRIGLE